MDTNLVSGSRLIPNMLFYSSLVPNAISCSREASSLFLPSPCTAVFILVFTFVFGWPHGWRSFSVFPVPITEGCWGKEEWELMSWDCPFANSFLPWFPHSFEEELKLRCGTENSFCLSWCLIMYATSLGGLSGLGTFYKRDLLMTKLMWLSEWVWEAYSRLKENLLE